MPNQKDEKSKRLDQQIVMLQKDFTLWVSDVIGDKEYSFRMSDHFASFSEILKDSEE